jgi:hypothetical protein
VAGKERLPAGNTHRPTRAGHAAGGKSPLALCAAPTLESRAAGPSGGISARNLLGWDTRVAWSMPQAQARSRAQGNQGLNRAGIHG